MFSLDVSVAPDDYDVLIAELWAAGSVGITELTGELLRAFFEDHADRNALVEQFSATGSADEVERDWVAISRANWEPLAVGKRFLLVPEWRDDPAPEGRFRIVVNPGMAFGTGIHETTQMCLEALEDYLRAGGSVLDVGTGSGILTEAAGLLGAGSLWACDIDPVAVEIGRAKTGPNLFAGSVDAVRSSVADVIVANISPEAIALLAPDLLRCLRPEGTALLSGFEIHEVAAVEAELQRQGAGIVEIRRKGNWALLVARATPEVR